MTGLKKGFRLLIFGLGIILGACGNQQTAPSPPPWANTGLNAVTYGGGLYVIVGYSGTILTSTTGESWTQRESPSFLPLYGVAYGNRTYVAVGEFSAVTPTIILTSQDGVNWVRRRVDDLYQSLLDVVYAQGQFVAVGGFGTILTSPDGITWTRQPRLTYAHLRGITYGNGLFVAVGDQGVILTSPDGVNWTARDIGFPSPYFSDVAYGDGKFVAVAWSTPNYFYISSDGLTWTRQQNPDPNDSFWGIAYGNGVFGAVGASGLWATSSDGVTWNKSKVADVSLRGVAYGTRFVVVGDKGTILISR